MGNNYGQEGGGGFDPPASRQSLSMLTSIYYPPHISITLLLFRAVGPFFNNFWVRNGRVVGGGDWSAGC